MGKKNYLFYYLIKLILLIIIFLFLKLQININPLNINLLILYIVVFNVFLCLFFLLLLKRIDMIIFFINIYLNLNLYLFFTIAVYVYICIFFDVYPYTTVLFEWGDIRIERLWKYAELEYYLEHALKSANLELTSSKKTEILLKLSTPESIKDHVNYLRGLRNTEIVSTLCDCAKSVFNALIVNVPVLSIILIPVLTAAAFYIFHDHIFDQNMINEVKSELVNFKEIEESELYGLEEVQIKQIKEYNEMSDLYQKMADHINSKKFGCWEERSMRDKFLSSSESLNYKSDLMRRNTKYNTDLVFKIGDKIIYRL